MTEDDGRIPVSVETHSPRLSLEELAVDVSAFLHFLSEHYDGDRHSEVPSFWMLIPKSLDVEWREGTAEFFLEKEVFSRKILIVASPPGSEAERQKRRAELLLLFHNAIAEDQLKQILLLLSRLKEESRQAMIEKFHEYQERQSGSATSP